MHNVMPFLTYNSFKKGIIAMEKIGFRLNTEKNESENKTIRFPLPLIKEIEKTLEGTELTFSRFVIQACEYALENMEPKKETQEKIHS